MWEGTFIQKRIDMIDMEWRSETGWYSNREVEGLSDLLTLTDLSYNTFPAISVFLLFAIVRRLLPHAISI